MTTADGKGGPGSNQHATKPPQAPRDAAGDTGAAAGTAVATADPMAGHDWDQDAVDAAAADMVDLKTYSFMDNPDPAQLVAEESEHAAGIEPPEDGKPSFGRTMGVSIKANGDQLSKFVDAGGTLESRLAPEGEAPVVSAAEALDAVAKHPQSHITGRYSAAQAGEPPTASLEAIQLIATDDDTAALVQRIRDVPLYAGERGDLKTADGQVVGVYCWFDG